jgi:hypothetical protein
MFSNHRYALFLVVPFSVLFTFRASGQGEATAPSVDCTFVGSTKHTCGLKVLAESLKTSRTVAVVAYDVVPTWDVTAQGLSASISDRGYNSERDRYFRQYVQPTIPRSYSLSASYMEFMKETSREVIRPGIRKGALGRLTGTEAQDKHLRAQAEELVSSWHRFRMVSDPQDADVTIEIRKYPFSTFGAEPELPAAVAIIWPRGANPSKDNILWFERFSARWRENNVVRGVLRQLHESVERAEGVEGPNRKAAKR